MRSKKRRTGNGTANWQKLYVMANVPFLFIWKIGITGNLRQRVFALSKQYPGVMIPVIYVNMPFAYQHEQFLLRVTGGALYGIGLFRKMGFDGTEFRNVITGLFLAIWVLILIFAKWGTFFFCAYKLLEYVATN